MQLIHVFPDDRTADQIAEQQAQPPAQPSFPNCPQLIAQWEIVDGKLECHWIQI
jgi:hypothetical protein